MNVSSIAQLATSLSSQRQAMDASIAVAKLAKGAAEANGQAALQLIDSASKPHGSLGHNINVTA